MTENLSTPAAALWAAEQAALVRGLAHALSNRVGTVVAVGGMLAPDAPAPAMVVGMLQDEGGRMEELLALMRLVAGEADESPDPEPIHLPDIVTPVVALHGHHPALRDVPVKVEPDPDAPPVRARYGGFVRALLVLLSAAKAGEDDVVVRWWRDGRSVVIGLGGAAGREEIAVVARLLLGGAVRATNEGYALTLPAL